jgi:hypothetical protein
MPNAIVATTIAVSEVVHQFWTLWRSSVSMPAWYGRASKPADSTRSASVSAVRC